MTCTAFSKIFKTSKFRECNLSRPGSVRYRFFRHGEHGNNTIGVADIEEHALRDYASHFAWLKIHHEQCLLAFNFSRIGSLLLHSGDDGALVIAENYSQL